MEEQIPSIGQYWVFDPRIFQYPGKERSLWRVIGIGEDDRGEGLWVSLVLISKPSAGQPGHLDIGQTGHYPVDAFAPKLGWTQVPEDDVPLMLLGDL